MTDHEVVHLWRLLVDRGTSAWIDGGWGVDALLGEQTREHGDLDLVIEGRDEDVTRAVLRDEGFSEVPMWFTTPVHTVWQDDGHRCVDLHVITLDERGVGVFGDEGEYPADGLTGTGRIGHQAVRCISPAVQLEFHRGYDIRDQDRHDVARLSQRFDLPLPPEYRESIS